MTRYDLVTNYRAGSSIEEMERSDDGECVRYEEVEALKAEIKHLVLTTPNIEGRRGNDELRHRLMLLVEAAPGTRQEER